MNSLWKAYVCQMEISINLGPPVQKLLDCILFCTCYSCPGVMPLGPLGKVQWHSAVRSGCHLVMEWSWMLFLIPGFCTWCSLFSGMLSLVPSFLPGKFLLIFQNPLQVFPWVSCKQNYSVLSGILHCFISKVMTAKRLCGDRTVSLNRVIGGLW